MPARYAPILFSALLSAIMVIVVSAYVLLINQGLHAGFLSQWLISAAKTWPIAFPTVALVAPPVRRLVATLTAPAI
ncbi:DUF2798 domain-containing protein [Ahniella affigens]|uniref:DUF2798 domain-containing protein n=1 Tax=Ahniella affigens TaxID=2021234 RepID=A0A2P1PYS0_9GAMM|nr:DUF2798 domain-containing protein [Ahniella affigens]